MSQFKFRDGNLGFYRYDHLAEYTVASRTDTSMVLDWNPALGTLDPTRSAAHVTLTYGAYVSYVVEDGPDAGAERVTGGTLTGITFGDAAGNALLEISKLALRLPTFLATLERGDGFGAWQMVAHVGAAITGSASAAGPGHAGTGDFVDTTAGNDAVTAMGGDDFVQDRGGADGYAGGSGSDALSYAAWNFSPCALS